MFGYLKRTVTRRRVLGVAAGLAASTLALPAPVSAAEFPERPITIVVMYSAGGGTDTIMRKLADEMSAATGWTVNVVNRPGAVGGVATKFVSAQRPDGYTILGGANYNRFVRVMGHADFTPWEDWVPLKAGTALASWSVPVDSPFQTLQDVVDAARERPGEVTISTSGTGGVWHELSMIISDTAGAKLKYIPYKGGKPATLAGLQGETDIAGGGLHEHIDLIRAGKLRNLAHTGAEDIVLDDGTVLPSIASALPEAENVQAVGATYNFLVPRDVPAEAMQKLADAFVAAASSDGFQEMLKSKFFQSDIKVGEEADREGALMEAITVDIFNKFQDQIGAEVKTADELGLPKPSEFDSWWPPAGYTPPPITNSAS